ncbi:PAS domain S-box protein [Campylobacter novaezeelandiae]|uniref:PAS domain-containing protein n=1 Tax=Campylobacter novaezeelandiae TaxID=2267891 RepID=UPI001038285B|nr:PAS domain-containing protein [Campylobacter novaezeelandiae]TBR80038.1 PAS domain S-box protein [Campylobacter novaezeelandiae]
MSKEIFLTKYCLITSKTDLQGRIVYANADFLKYAGFSMNEILYKPHNIVRHSSMPKAVFKLLWEYMKEKKEIFAFVKNKSKNGDYYWVFANVTPSFDSGTNKIIGYYSVRRQPNKKAVDIIENFYDKLLKIEDTEGINASLKTLNEFCKSQNKTYNELMFHLQES